jgi:hypothetical protein
MERFALQNNRISDITPSVPAVQKDKVRLTGDRDWHIKKWTIPRYKKEDLVYTPLATPNVLDFAIEEEEPVVHLAIG